jgi:hypothetical protein
VKQFLENEFPISVDLVFGVTEFFQSIVDDFEMTRGTQGYILILIPDEFGSRLDLVLFHDLLTTFLAKLYSSPSNSQIENPVEPYSFLNIRRPKARFRQ